MDIPVLLFSLMQGFYLKPCSIRVKKCKFLRLIFWLFFSLWTKYPFLICPFAFAKVIRLNH